MSVPRFWPLLFLPWSRANAVSASVLKVLFDWVYLVALSAWVGSQLLVSILVGPWVFRSQDAGAGSKVVHELLPRYCQWCATAAAVALPAMVAVPLCYPELRRPSVGVHALLIIAAVLLMLHLGNSLAPALCAAKEGGAESHARWQRLAWRAVLLNSLVLMIGLGLLFAFAARPLPRTSGIVEPTPRERARLEFEAGAARGHEAPTSPEVGTSPGR